MPMSESLSDKLKSLGVSVGARHIRPRQERRGVPISEVLPGRFVDTQFGTAFVVESEFPSDYQHGIVSFNVPCDLRMLCRWGQAPHLEETGIDRFLFLDTETTGLAGGTGTFAFMVGLGYWTGSGFRLVQLFMEDPAQEAAMIATLNQAVDLFTAVVSFNGKSFDIPLLNARCTLNGFDSPFPRLDHLDLLALARRLWRNRLPSRALGSLEVDILNVSRSQEEIPGWMIPEMYYQYLRSRDARPLAGVFYHNAMDILSLAALFRHTADLLTDPLRQEQPESLDIIAIARLYEELGHMDRAIDLYEAGLRLGLPDEFLLQTIMRFATLYRRRGEWQRAIDLWKMAAERRCMEACVELAKFYEHQARSYEQALEWTRRAIDLVPEMYGGVWARRIALEELTHRQNRLLNKLGRNSKAEVLE